MPIKLSDEQIAKSIKITIALIVILLIWFSGQLVYDNFIKKNKDYYAMQKAELKAKNNPNNLLARISLANLLMTKKHTNEAIKQYKQALKINDKYDLALVGIGYAYFKKGDDEKALNYFNKEINEASSGSKKFIDRYLGKAYFYKGEILFNKKSYNKAIKNLKKSLKITPLMSDTYYFLGRSKQALGKKKEAIRDYKKALEFDPKFVDAKEALEKLGN